MRKVIVWTLLAMSMLGAVGAGFAGWVYQAASHEPTFYREALLITPTEAPPPSDVVREELEAEVLEFQEESAEPGVWTVEITADELNRWLAGDLPSELAQVLPAGVEDPRVAIEDGVVRVATRYRGKSVSSILSFALQFELADEPNRIAIRISEVRAGALPIPINSWLEKVRRAVHRTNLAVQWSHTSGDPVALVTIPEPHEDSDEPQVIVETIAVERGVVRLSGISIPSRVTHRTLRPIRSSVVHRTSLRTSVENEIHHR